MPMNLPRASFTGLALLLTLAGTGCQLPERPYSFLPPTNEKQLCQSDRRFFYSADFDVCFRYPKSDDWKDVRVSDLISVNESDISSYDFTRLNNGKPERLFSLYITTLNDHEKSFADNGITLVAEKAPYAFGMIAEAGREEEIRRALKSLYVFAKPAPEK